MTSPGVKSLLVAEVLPSEVDEGSGHQQEGDEESHQQDVGGHGVALQRGGPGGQLLVVFHLVGPEN